MQVNKDNKLVGAIFTLLGIWGVGVIVTSIITLSNNQHKEDTVQQQQQFLQEVYQDGTLTTEQR